MIHPRFALSTWALAAQVRRLKYARRLSERWNLAKRVNLKAPLPRRNTILWGSIKNRHFRIFATTGVEVKPKTTIWSCWENTMVTETKETCSRSILSMRHLRLLRLARRSRWIFDSSDNSMSSFTVCVGEQDGRPHHKDGKPTHGAAGSRGVPA